MAYTPILSHSNASVASITKGIPSNTPRGFIKSIEGTNNLVVDYYDKLSPVGDFERLLGTRALIISLRNMLLTPLGTYPFDPVYGTLLHEKVFMPADQQTEEEIKFEVLDRVAEFDSRIVVTDVITEFFNNNKGYRLTVFLEFSGSSANLQVDIVDEVGFTVE